MNLNTVIDELATALDTIDGLRVTSYVPESINVPAGIVAYPGSITFDATYGRGMDRVTIPILIVSSKVVSRTSRVRMGEYASGSGAKSVKAVIEAGTYTEADTIHVVDAEFDIFTINNIDYISAQFTVEVTGTGA